MDTSSRLFEELEEVVRCQLGFNRTDGQAWLQLAWKMIESQRLQLAILCFHETVRLVPSMVEAWANLGSLYRRAGQLEPSVACYREAVQRQPTNVRLILATAATLRLAGLRIEAKNYCEKALSLDPESAELLMLLGNIHQELDHFDAAIEYLESGIRRAGRTSQNVSCLGIAYYRRGDVELAISLFRESIAANPQNHDSHFHLGMALLLVGDYRQGWEEYEWRTGGRWRPMQNVPIPWWDGQPLSKQQTLLIAAEQGYGDTIQFVRLMADLKSKVECKIILQAPRPLLPLLRTCRGLDSCIARDEPLPPIDCFLPLASVPSVLQYHPEQSKPRLAYLSADDLRTQFWGEFLNAKVVAHSTPRCLRIGLSWQGDPKFPADHCRSIPLKHLSILTDTPNTKWFSLQKGYGTEQLTTLAESTKIVDFGDRLDSNAEAFLDTAAIMQHLDLVITSDTAIAHLAGACGVPVWIGLSFVPDWRWNLHRNDSVWYPTARLFRQTKLGDWGSLIHPMQQELTKFKSRV